MRVGQSAAIKCFACRGSCSASFFFFYYIVGLELI